MKQTFQLGAFSAAGIGIAFLIQWYVLIQLGPGAETDALFAGMALPQLALAVISGSLMHVLVPLLAGETPDRLRHDAWGFFILVGSFFGLLATILYVAAPWWVPLIVPGFDEAGKSLTIQLSRIQLIGMVFAAINGVQWAAYHARRRFLWAEFSPVLASTAAIVLLVWALPRYGVVAAAWISTFRMVLQTFLLAPGMGMPIRPDLKSGTLQQSWQRIKPLMLGTAYYKTDPLVDRILLSMAGSGSLSLYYIAQQIYNAVGQIINKAVSAPLVPLLSMLFKAGNLETFWRVYRRKLLQVSAFGLTCLVVFVLFGPILLDLLIGRGSVSEDNVDDLWWIMMWLGGMFFGGVAGQICSSTFYACGDTITPTRMSVLTYTAYIPSKVVAYGFFGVKGLAMATSFYYMTNLLLQIYLLAKKRIV